MAVATISNPARLDRRNLLFGRRPSEENPAGPGAVTRAPAGVRGQLAHLFRRAGFGASKEDLDRFEALGYQAAVSYLLDYEAVPGAVEERLAMMELDLTKAEDLKRWWIVRLRYTARPLQEKMTLFLHGLVTSGLSKAPPPLMWQQNHLLRANALGSYRDLLVAVTSDPAMLIWLDGRNSRKQHPNENYARELMELFTIGIGNYSEDDVQQAARAFTGWNVPKDAMSSVFNPRAFDDRAKTFMGQTGKFTGEQVIDLILGQRVAAEFLARKLWSFFVYPNPSPAAISPLADVLQGSGYSLRAAMTHILTSEAFLSPRAYRSIVKSPVDLVIGSLRTLGLDTDGKELTYLLRIMGQDLLNPPNVAGWPGGAAWLNGTYWLNRANFANAIATRRQGEPGTVMDLAGLAAKEGITAPNGLRDHLMGLLVDGQLDPASRGVIDAYLATGEPLRLTATSLGRKGRGLLYLLLASPEYQLL